MHSHVIHRPRMLISGVGDMGQQELSKAFLHEIENMAESVFIASLAISELIQVLL